MRHRLGSEVLVLGELLSGRTGDISTSDIPVAPAPFPSPSQAHNKALNDLPSTGVERMKSVIFLKGDTNAGS